MRFFLEISFDGTGYNGWQIQPRANTVQAEINKALAKLLGHEVKTTGCGRTDTGVHARQFFLHFDTPQPPIDEFIYKVNRLLPDDISVKRLFAVHDDARSRQDALKRTYQYNIHLKKNPFLNRFSFYFPYGRPDFETLCSTAALLMTFRDFKPLSKTDTQEKTTICTIFHSDWEMTGAHTLRYTITADHFLRGMARMCVGAMLMAATGKMDAAQIAEVMEKREHFKYVLSVPGCGLSLIKVEYPY